MTSMAQEPRDAALPAHPLWCEQTDAMEPEAHSPLDPYHRSEPLHAELQEFEVAVSAAIVQLDDGGPWEPKIELVARDRSSIYQVSAHASLDEMKALRAMLTKQINELQRYHDMASAPHGRLYTLDWQPGEE